MNRKHTNYPCALIWKFPLAYISEYATEALVHGHSNPSIKSSVWLPFESSRLTQGLGLAAWSHFRLISHDKRAVIIIRKKNCWKIKGKLWLLWKSTWCHSWALMTDLPCCRHHTDERKTECVIPGAWIPSFKLIDLGKFSSSSTKSMSFFQILEQFVKS